MQKNSIKIMKQYFVASFIILLVACSKENSDSFLPDPTNPINDTAWAATTPLNAAVNTLPTDLAIAEVSDSFPNTSGRTIQFNDSLEVTVPNNAVTTNNGTTITGSVNLSINYLNKKGDFIRFARPTTNGNLLLESSGGFFVRAIQNTQDLSLAQGKTLKIKFKNNNPTTTTKVFYGDENLTPPLLAPFNFNWKLNTDNSEINVVYTTTPNLYKGYELSAKKLRWVAGLLQIDTLLPKTIVTVIFNPNFTNKNTAVYAVYKNLNTVVRLTPNFTSRSFAAVNMLLNKNIYLISISKIGTTYYLGNSEVTITNGLSLKLNPELKSLNQIKSFLDSL